MTENCYMTSLDLKNAYYSIPIAKEHQIYFKFMWNYQRYAFSFLPMGISSCPRIFTKLMKPVFVTFRINFVIHASAILMILYNMGIIIMNVIKSHLLLLNC